MTAADPYVQHFHGHRDPDNHRTVGRRAWCHTCTTWCYPHHGCLCCNEPAYDWLLAEARWEARMWRMVVTQISLSHGLIPDNEPFPWEAD